VFGLIHFDFGRPIILIGLCALVLLVPNSLLAKRPGTDSGGPDVITIVLVGDVGLNRSGLAVHKDGVKEGRGVLPWQRMTERIEPLIDGDINFMNLETVVSSRNDLDIDRKGQKNPYNFVMHPEGVRHLVRMGFNLISLANNHSHDFRSAGVVETLENIGLIPGDRLLAHAGLGHNREEAGRPKIFDIRGTQFAFSAIGIVTNNNNRHRAGPSKPGQVAYRFDRDWKYVINRLQETKVDYRILSIHYGYEGKVKADRKQIKEWRNQAVRERGIDLVVGHHAHVVRGIEINGDSIIFYGLGNFMHRGTRNMAAVPKYRLCRDFGLLAKVHLAGNSKGEWQTRAIEVVPVFGMHRIPREIGDSLQARRRIEVVNYHARQFDDEKAGSKGVRFLPRKDGSGLYCFPGAKLDSGQIGALCRDYAPPPTMEPELAREISHACNR